MASRVSAIYWGTNGENVVQLGYPLRDVVGDRLPRDGSQWVQGMSGVEDAWITGYDSVLSLLMQFVPVTPHFYGAQAPNALQSALSGAGSVQGFLDWARQKQTFSFVPDILNAPLFAVPGCYLAEPVSTRLGGRALSARLDYMQDLVIRNPTY